MVNNSTNINKMKQSPLTLTQLTQKKDHDIWCWKSRSWFRTGTYLWLVKLVNGIPILPSWQL